MSQSTSKLSPKAEQLLNAHTQWWVDKLSSPELSEHLAAEIKQLLLDLEGIKLKELATEAAVKKVVKKHIQTTEFSENLQDNIANIAQAIYQHDVHAETPINTLLPDMWFEKAVDEALAMKGLRQTLIHETVSNPIFSGLIAELLYSGIRDYVTSSSKLAAKVPGSKTAMRFGKAVMSRTSSDFSEGLEESLKAYVRKNTESSLKTSEHFLLAALDSDELRNVIMTLWSRNKDSTLGDIRDMAGDLDMQQLTGLAYRYWQHLRQTDWLQELVLAGIHSFYEQYGNADVPALLADLGIDQATLLADAMVFAPPIIKRLHKKELLQPMIQRQLQGFYASEQAQAILGE